jgi:hypothetical protein
MIKLFEMIELGKYKILFITDFNFQKIHKNIVNLLK